MNKVEITGRLTRDAEIRYAGIENKTAIASFTVAINRKFTEGTDFIDCKAFGKTAEFIEKYFGKGMKIEVCGRIQKDSYTNKDGKNASITYVVAEDVDFAESKRAEEIDRDAKGLPASVDGFTNIPDGLDEELPFAQPTRR